MTIHAVIHRDFPIRYRWGILLSHIVVTANARITGITNMSFMRKVNVRVHCCYLQPRDVLAAIYVFPKEFFLLAVRPRFISVAGNAHHDTGDTRDIPRPGPAVAGDARPDILTCTQCRILKEDVTPGAFGSLFC